MLFISEMSSVFSAAPISKVSKNGSNPFANALMEYVPPTGTSSKTNCPSWSVVAVRWNFAGSRTSEDASKGSGSSR